MSTEPTNEKNDLVIKIEPLQPGEPYYKTTWSKAAEKNNFANRRSHDDYPYSFENMPEDNYDRMDRVSGRRKRNKR